MFVCFCPNSVEFLSEKCQHNCGSCRTELSCYVLAGRFLLVYVCGTFCENVGHRAWFALLCLPRAISLQCEGMPEASCLVAVSLITHNDMPANTHLECNLCISAW